MLGVDFAREAQVAPLSRTPEVFTVATVAPEDTTILREVERRTGLRADARAATASQVLMLIDLAASELAARDVVWESAVQWLVDQRALSPEAVAQLKGQGHYGWGLAQQLESTRLARRDDLLQAGALLLGVPAVDMDRHVVLDAVLSLLPDPPADDLVPIFRVGSWLVVESDDLPEPASLRAIERGLGLHVQPELAWPPAIEAARARAAAAPPDGPLRSARPSLPGSASWIAALIARNNNEDIAFVERRVASTRAAAAGRLREARGAIRLVGEGAAVSAAALIPKPVATALNLNPIEVGASSVTVAVTQGLPPRVPRALEQLSGMGVIQRRGTVGEIRSALMRMPDPDQAPPRPSLLDTLAAGAYVPIDLLQRAEAGGDLEQVIAAPRDEGGIDGATFAEARAISYGLPNVSPLRWLPDRTVLRHLSEADVAEFQACPLRWDDGVVTIAFTDPAPERVRALSDRIGRPVLAAVAPPGEFAMAAASRGVDRGEVPSSVHLLTDRLVQAGKLSPADRVRAWHLVVDERLPGDEAVLAASTLMPADVAAEMAQVAGVPLVSLDLREEAREVVDAVGVRSIQTITVDPVDPAAAYHLPRPIAEQHVAISYEERDGRLTVAFADPTDEAARAAVQEALSSPITVVAAPRGEVRAATKRVNGQFSLGEHLRLAGIISRTELQHALRLSRATGVRLGQALRELRYITAEQLASFLAEQHEVPFFDLAEMELEEQVVRRLSEATARRYLAIPIFVTDSGITVAMSDPLNTAALETIRREVGQPVQPVWASEEAIEQVLERIYRAEYVERAATELLVRFPEDSASTVFTKRQLLWAAGIGALVVLGLLLDWKITLQVLFAAAAAFYTAFSSYKFYLIYRALGHEFEVPTSKEELAELGDASLPIYTVLVPMYREPQIVPLVVSALNSLDYPRSKLDIKVILEEDDAETVEAVRRLRLPPHMEMLIVPQGDPKGKPKACNYGLLHARGEYLVIYDAEDVPEIDQLRKAVVAFRKLPDEYVCLQAKLNYFNRNQNILTRWFTSAYSMWFDLLMPGLDGTGAPIPLGGTSNHFKTDRLREVGGWDPFNVTEDADVGLRIFKRGWNTAVIDSTTFEEANSAVGNWIRQRSRWVKGYMQTWLVHMRRPIKLWRELGTYGFFSFQMIMAGTIFGFLANPIFWTITVIWLVFRPDFINDLFPTPIFFMGAVTLYFGNFAFAYVAMAGALRRRYYGLVKWGLISPLYWILMSVAAWKAAYQLIFRPFYWEKTEHGLFRGEVVVSVGTERR